jgi:hypothetical protein
MTWVSTGISVGVAIGSTAAGFVLDALGPRWGYALAGTSGVAAALTYLASLGRLTAPGDAAATEAGAPACPVDLAAGPAGRPAVGND